MPKDRRRASYLLEGRRVNVRDLLEVGLVQVGEELTFSRPRKGATHTAVIEQDGRLLMDEVRYSAPSPAATAATGHQTDGWTAWVTPDGKYLSELRAILVDRDATSLPSENDDSESASRLAAERYDFLRRSRAAAENGHAEKVPVRDLIAYWGARARAAEVMDHVDVELDNYGLYTQPDFRAVALEDEVEVLLVLPQIDGIVDEEMADQVGLDDGNASDIRRRTVGITLGNLIRGGRSLVSVNRGSALDEARTKMLMNDFSQIPVLNGERSLAGAVTWASLVTAQLRTPNPTLADATVPCRISPYTEELNKVLPIIRDEEFVVVSNSERKITAIITSADVIDLFEERTLPFLLIGELDQELRRAMVNLDFSEVRDFLGRSNGRKIRSFDDMTMGDYQAVLSYDNFWGQLQWSLDRASFTARLEDLRRIRNDVTHFNPDALPVDAIEHLRGMLKVLRMFNAYR